MPERSEQTEITFPYGEIVKATGKDLRALHVLRDHPLVTKAELAQAVWQRELHHPNSFLRMELGSVLTEYTYLPARINRVRGLLPRKYELEEMERGLLFIKEREGEVVESQILAQLDVIKSLGFATKLGLTDSQYLQTLPNIIDAPPSKLGEDDLVSVLVEPRVELSEQLRLQNILPEISEEKSDDLDVMVNNTVIGDNRYQWRMPYYLRVHNGTQYMGGLGVYEKLRSREGERPSTLLEGIAYVRAVQALGIRIRDDLRMVMAGSYRRTRQGDIQYPYFHFLAGEVRMRFISSGSSYMNYGIASAFKT